METSVIFKFMIFNALFFAYLSASEANSSLTCKSRFLNFENVKNRYCLNNCTTISDSDPRYDDLRRHANNLRHVSDAAFIVLPKNTADVVLILENALRNGLRPTVRSGGHCYEDFWSNNTGGVLIDMSSMNKIYRSDDSAICVEAGVKIEQLYETLYKEFGLTIPAGTCFGMGVGGHVAGAGHGNLARPYGLIIDFVDSIELVHVTGHKRVATALVGRHSTIEKDRNLFWALLGGGSQNFGIITKVGFRNLPKSPPLVYTSSIRWSLPADMDKEGFLEFLDKYIKFFVNNSDVDSKFCAISTALMIGRKATDGPYMSLNILLLGSNRDLVDEVVAGLGLNNTGAQNISCQQMSYYRYVQSSGGRNPLDGYYYTAHSAYMVGPMPIHQRETFWRYITDPAYSSVVDGTVQIRSFGCAVSRVPENGTAYPHRRAVIKMQYGNTWYDDKRGPIQQRWSKEFYKAMYGQQGPRPDGIMDGCFVNYPDAELVDWQHLYFKNNYERLQHAKQEWDPLNIFHHRQSVELPKVAR